MRPPSRSVAEKPFHSVGNDRVQMDPVALLADAEDGLGRGAIEPTGRAGVPRPAAAPGDRAGRIDVGGDHIGFDAVAFGCRCIEGVVDRVQHAECTPGLVGQAELGKRDDEPGRRVRVLAAVLAHPRRIALDVAGVLLGLVERRREQLDDLEVARRPACRSPSASPSARAPRRPGRTERSTIGRSRRSGTRRKCANRAACRHHSCRGDTIRRPSRPLPAPSSWSSHAFATRRRAACRRRTWQTERNRLSVFTRNQPSQTLSPLPSSPTRFMPSFQSPPRISGRPLAPVRLMARSSAAGAMLVDRRLVLGDVGRIERVVLARFQ